MISAILNVYMDDLLILTKKTDAIILPITLDGLAGSKLWMLLTNMYPEIEYLFKKNIMSENFKSGSILLYEKSNPKIIITPVAEKYLDPFNNNFIIDFVNKINSIKEIKGIKEISIEKWKFTDENLEIIKQNKNFKLKIFNHKELIEET